jgi:hypothetical protein
LIILLDYYYSATVNLVVPVPSLVKGGGFR